jgi:hypothetical protein
VKSNMMGPFRQSSSCGLSEAGHVVHEREGRITPRGDNTRRPDETETRHEFRQGWEKARHGTWIL